MAIFIDTGITAEARRAAEYGWVRGVTTNPILLAQSGPSADCTLKDLAALGFEKLFYQLTAKDPEGMLAEARAAQEIAGRALVLKISPAECGFRFVSDHSAEFPFCVTAVFSPAQAAVARECGARYVAVYLNRATRLLGDGPGLVREIAAVLASGSPAVQGRTEILAASIKSAEEAGTALAAGAQHLTLPFAVLETLTYHALSAETAAKFEAEGIGLERTRVPPAGRAV
jgi:transaldolase